MADLPARIDRAALERIIQRAAELQTGEHDLGDDLTEEQVLALGKEVGIPARHLQQALIEERVRAEPAEARFLDRVIGKAAITADRVVMGYVNITWQFLPKAFSLVKKGGIVHYQDTCSIDRIPYGLFENLRNGCGGRPFEVLGVREVKAYAPSISHMVVDVKVL